MKQILGILSVIVVIGAVIFVFSGKDHTNDPAPESSSVTNSSTAASNTADQKTQMSQSQTEDTSKDAMN